MQPLRAETGREPVSSQPPPPERDNVFMGSVWMVGITLVLFFLPVINGLIGGAVGGYKVGNLKRALTSAILPAIIAGLGLWGIFALLDHPVAGFIAGATTGLIVILADIGIFIGAAIGGKMAEKR